MKTKQEIKQSMEKEYREAMKAIEQFKGISEKTIQDNMRGNITREQARELCIANEMMYEYEKKSSWKAKISKKYEEVCNENSEMKESWEVINEIAERVQKEQNERFRNICQVIEEARESL